MKTTNQQYGLIRIVESEEDKVARLEKKKKTYGNLMLTSYIAMPTSSIPLIFVGDALFGIAGGMICSFGSLAVAATATLYYILKHEKVGKQLKNLYEKKQ